MVNQVDAVKRLPVTSLVRQSTFKFVSPPFYLFTPNLDPKPRDL